MLLPDLVDRAAARHPHREAFRHDGAALTYAELAARSNQLANALRAAGLRPGELAAIAMGKSLDNAVAVFGIQKAGAAYVPLDAAAPAARLDGILDDCGIRHVVADERHAGLAGERQVIDPADTVGASAEAPAAAASPDDPAYVIFTSGSTGTPKGIVHTHASGLAYARMAAELYGLRPDDRLSSFPPLHFDQSTFGFFSGPLAGATTVIVGEAHMMVPASLARLIEQERLTVWYSVPFALQQLLRYGAPAERDLTSLRWVVYGGEPFPPGDLAELMAMWPHARFSNCYGPAETNQCTYHHVTAADVAAGGPVPIGRTCPGMEAQVVGRDGREVPAGEEGELLVASPTTMRGYWNAPRLTAAAFDDRGARFYRTGDLVRHRPDGLLEFLGRRDRQVKARGHRVELDEVEAVLASSPDVKEAAAYAVGGDGATTIRASVILRPGADLAALRAHAAARLPRYALPAAIEVLADLPRTSSGKVDYPALSQAGVS